MIKLVINADDFGYSKVFNEKILDLLEKGFLKSTTVMVGRLTKEQGRQVERLKGLYGSKRIGVGLHLEFDVNEPYRPQIEGQYKKFISVFGFRPSHLDIHKITTAMEIVKEVNRFAEMKGLPVRNHGVETRAKHTTACLVSMRGLKDIKRVVEFLRKAEDGKSYEIMSHPGEYDPGCKSSLNKERRTDYEIIIRLQGFLKKHKNIKNISYLEL